MEIVLPSLLLLLAAAFFVFGLFPRLGPSVLVTLAIVSLILVVQHHMELFDLEYRDLTIVDSLKDNAPLMLIILTTGMIIGFFLLVTGFLSRRAPSGAVSPASFTGAETPEPASITRPNASKNNNTASKNNAAAKNNSKAGQSGQSLGAFFSKYA